MDKSAKTQQLEFKAELKEIKLTKLVSLDHMVRLSFVTEDKNTLKLGNLPPDTLFSVIVSEHK